MMLASSKGRSLAAAMPKERVLTETDAPFAQVGVAALMPWDVVQAYPSLAALWGCDAEAVDGQLRRNLISLSEALA